MVDIRPIIELRQHLVRMAKTMEIAEKQIRLAVFETEGEGRRAALLVDAAEDLHHAAEYTRRVANGRTD